MKQRLCYQWEQSDPSLTFLDEALNRLTSFQKPDQDEKYIRTFNRVVNGGDFEAEHIDAIIEYFQVLAKRAYADWGKGSSADKAIPEMGESIRQAADNATAAGKHLREVFDISKFQAERA